MFRRSASIVKCRQLIMYKAELLDELLFEPVVRVRLRVEGGHLTISSAAIELNRLFQRTVRLETRNRRAGLNCVLFELLEEPPSEAESARLRRHPHSLELGGRVGVELQCSAGDRAAIQAGDGQGTGGGGGVV